MSGLRDAFRQANRALDEAIVADWFDTSVRNDPEVAAKVAELAGDADTAPMWAEMRRQVIQQLADQLGQRWDKEQEDG